ncbi:inorganic diphosphatase [Psychroserpens algicola]|uniref:inorganic diphosphatase n=1 Tax=Psychroserpens algicola TaxID=1719034 RepID=A0ABT0HBN2_9FLAO|nr:inorganic diphosphatase [Psychroserpens algicola]MCK8481784.1 inorganic diphosphatase [Psychroserpens algicola]
MVSKSAILFFIICSFLSCETKKEYYSLPSKGKEGSFNAVIEIPAGTNRKIEYHKNSREFKVDIKNGKERVIQFFPYIGNYGFIPSTLSDSATGGDGDALDVLVLSENVPTGTVVEVLPIAMLKLIDDGELDYKIIAVPLSQKSRIIDVKTYVELKNKFPEVITIIELWFLNYNKEEDAKINGWGNELEAVKEISKNEVNEI